MLAASLARAEREKSRIEGQPRPSLLALQMADRAFNNARLALAAYDAAHQAGAR